MIDTIKDIILINLYWFSLPLIGYVILRVARDEKKIPRSIKNISHYTLSQHPFSIFVFSFALTVFLCAVVSVFFYVFHLPVKALAVLYLGVLLLTCLYVVNVFLRNLFKVTNLDVFGLKNKILLTQTIFLLMIAILAIDFFISLYVKSFAWGDAIYHMSRVVNILSDGFNVQASFFSNLPDGAYHYNVIYSLYAVPSKIFHLEPIRVWEFSLAFYRLMQWLAVFTLAMHVFGKWLKAGESTLPMSFLSVILAVAFNSYHQGYIANYPNQIVDIWFILLVICLSFQSKINKKAIGLVMISLGFLLTSTHPTYAFIAACFIAFLFVIRAVIDRNNFFADKYDSMIYLMTIAVLMVGPVVTKLTPVRLSNDMINLAKPNLINIFGMSMMRPSLPIDKLGWVVLITGMLATGFLLKKLWKRKLEWSIIFSLSFFFLIIAFVPIVFTILHYLLPVWVIDRFSAMNVLSYLFAAVVIYGVYFIFINFINKGLSMKNKIAVAKFIGVVFMLFSLFLSSTISFSTYNLYLYGTESKIYAYNYMNQTIYDFKDVLKDNKIIVSSPYYSYQLSALFDIDVIAVEYGHSPMSSDGANRGGCQEYILKNFNFQDLKAVKTDYVVVSLMGDMKSEENLVKSKPYLKLIGSNPYFAVYEFDKKSYSDSSLLTYQPCLNYQQIEKK